MASNIHSFLSAMNVDPETLITPITTGETFPESAVAAVEVYAEDIRTFQKLIKESASSADLLARIRDSKMFDRDIRGSLLKLFRRCVSLVVDTEKSTKIKKYPTDGLVQSYGHTFKDIAKLQSQFADLTDGDFLALAALLAENDNRGQSGYLLTGKFFEWFEATFPQFCIEGPRGAGKDIELRTLFPDFESSYPCDFVVKQRQDEKILAVGFARYDSTRGGSQSDDRTGGNANKVDKALAFHAKTGNKFRILFLADGPGLTHGDTWKEACLLDGLWEDNVRVTTLKLAAMRVTADWLQG